MEHAGGELGRVGTSVERAVVGDDVDAQTGDLAVGGSGQFAVHVVVTGEGGRRDVFDAVFHPFHGAAQDDGGHDGAHIAGVNADLVAKAATDVGTDDAHLGLGNAREHGHHRAHDVGRLTGDEGGQVAFDRVEGRHTAAGLQRARVHAGVVHVLRDGHGSVGKRGIGCGLIARIPSEDVVVVVALAVRAFGLAGQVITDDGRTGLQSGIGVHDHGQLFVFDFHGLHRIGRDVAVVGDHDGDFLHLEVHFFIGQHRGHVAGQGGHPVQLQGFQVVGGEHGVHARDGQRGFFVDALDATVGDGAAHDVHVQHAGHFDVVNVVALALDKASIFFAQARCAHACQREFAGFCGWYRCVHVCLRSNGGVLQAATGSCSFLAAYWTALMMFW